MSWNWCCLSDLCRNWCHDVSNAEKITLEKLPNLQEIRLKQGDQRWYFAEQISKTRVLVSSTTKGYEWMVWKNENNYAIFGKMVQEEGESPSGWSTRSCPTDKRFQHLRATVSLKPLGQ